MTLGTTLPAGKPVTLGTDADGWVKRAFVALIAFYLVVTLALPLGTMLSKSLNTYRFDLNAYEFQVSDETGTRFGPAMTAADLNATLGRFSEADLATSSDGRLAATELFPDFNFRSPVKYRLRATTSDAAWLVGLDRVSSQDWQDYDSNSFRRISLRPVTDTGFGNYVKYFSDPTLFRSIGNSLSIAALTAAITVTLAFGFAYALSRSCMRMKGLFRMVAMMPILVPSLLPGIALVYLFGNQGVLKDLLMGHSIYGPLGIVVGSVFFTFPHAFIILSTALATADQRHYEAAQSLKASPSRTFWTVTLPGARFGLVSAIFVVFTLTITDFGLPKVIGGQFNVLALDIYKQVIGQQNFEMGAVVSVLLLVPAVLAFVIDRRMQKRQVSLLSGRAVPYQPRPNRRADLLAFAYCAVVALFILTIIGFCQLAALVKFWPYDLSLTLKNFDFGRMDGGGWQAYGNSLRLAVLTSVIGTVVVFTGAYMVEKVDGFALGRTLFQFLAMLPMAVPGMVLGLSYIFFFNNPANPLGAIYGTMAILVVSTVTHFYTVGHLTALTALKQIDPEFESVAASMRQPFHRLVGRVTLPICLPTMLEVAIYLFVNAMTTVSAVVFLYSAHTAVASVAVLNMDDAGDIAPAAAMGMLIFYTNVAARLLHSVLSRRLVARSQRWRLARTS